jgi:hypothetical protein
MRNTRGRFDHWSLRGRCRMMTSRGSVAVVVICLMFVVPAVETMVLPFRSASERMFADFRYSGWR